MSTRLSPPRPDLRIALFGLVVLAVVLAGCMPSNAVAPVAPAPAAATVAPPAPTVAPAAPTSAPESTAAPAPAGATGPATVMLTKNDQLGSFLADDQGRTLYLFTTDTANTSTCYDKCAQFWPPLLTQGAAKAGDGVDASLLGTTTRKDGSIQVTYNGWPLYYFAKDQKPGDVMGQGVLGTWYVVSPKGEKIEVGESSSSGASGQAASTPAPTAAAAGASAGATTAASLMVTKNDQLGSFLADDQGRTLYLFTKDTPNTSNCNDKCAQLWPPLLTKGSAKAGNGVDASLLGTTTRKDGSTQVTYNGWPLYHFSKDQKPGDVMGEEVAGVWYVVSPKGDKVEAAESSSSGASGQAASQTVTISAKNFAFNPKELTVSVGTTVVWHNDDNVGHTVTSDTGLFDGNLPAGADFQFTFTQAGTYAYHCTPHVGLGMTGVITVK